MNIKTISISLTVFYRTGEQSVPWRRSSLILCRRNCALTDGIDSSSLYCKPTDDRSTVLQSASQKRSFGVAAVDDDPDPFPAFFRIGTIHSTSRAASCGLVANRGQRVTHGGLSASLFGERKASLEEATPAVPTGDASAPTRSSPKRDRTKTADGADDENFHEFLIAAL